MGSQEASVGYPALKATGLTVNRSTGKAAPECLVGMDVIDLQCQSSGPTPHNETKRERPQSSVVGRDSAWMACGGALSILGGAPNVLMAYLWPQVQVLLCT